MLRWLKNNLDKIIVVFTVIALQANYSSNNWEHWLLSDVFKEKFIIEEVLILVSGLMLVYVFRKRS